MRVPRWVLYIAGVAPVGAIFALLLWGLVFRDGAGSPSGVTVFNSSGEADVILETPSEFTLLQFDGTTISLSDFIGQPVMVDFWASWCLPCRQEAEALESVWRDYRDRGVMFIGVNAFDDSAGSARAFIREFGITYPVGSDPDGIIAIGYGVTGLPEKFFINREGRIVRRFVGAQTEESLTGVLDQLLASASSASES